MANQYNYSEADKDKQILNNQVTSIATHMETLQGVIVNFIRVEGFSGATERQVKAFMSEVAQGTIESINVLIGELNDNYENMNKRFKDVDGGDDVVIYDDKLNDAIDKNDSFAKRITDKVAEINHHIQQAINLNINLTKCDTTEIKTTQDLIKTKITDFKNNFDSESGKSTEAESIDTFIHAVEQYVSYLGTCSPGTYQLGEIKKQSFYTDYFSKAEKFFDKKSDEYFTKTQITKKGPLELQKYLDRIDEMGKKSDENRINNLLYAAHTNGGKERVKEISYLNRILAQKYRNEYKTKVDDIAYKRYAERFSSIGHWIDNALPIANTKHRDPNTTMFSSALNKESNPYHLHFETNDLNSMNYTKISGIVDSGEKTIAGRQSRYEQAQHNLSVQDFFKASDLQNVYGSTYADEHPGESWKGELGVKTVANTAVKDIIGRGIPLSGSLIEIFDAQSQIEEEIQKNKDTKNINAALHLDDLKAEGSIVKVDNKPSEIEARPTLESQAIVHRLNEKHKVNYTFADYAGGNKEATKYLDEYAYEEHR